MSKFNLFLLAGMAMMMLACGLSGSGQESWEGDGIDPPVERKTPVGTVTPATSATPAGAAAPPVQSETPSDKGTLPGATETPTNTVAPIGLAPPGYDGPTSLEERILASPVIARVRLDSTVETVESATIFDGSTKYIALLEFSFSVQEYLKGSGADDIVAVWAAPYFDIQEHAEDALPAIAASRDAQWDDREAIVFLRHSATYLTSTQQSARFFLSGEVLFGNIPDDYYSLASRHNKLWLPAAESAGTNSQPTGDQQRFLMDVPPAAGTASTITLGEIKSRIAKVTAKLAAGDGSEEYVECVRESYFLERKDRHLRQIFPDRGSTGSNISPPHTHQLNSGQGAGTVVYVIAEGDPITPSVPFEVWLDDGDASLFSVASPSQDYRVTTTRPLPGREYEFHFNHRGPYFSRCDGNTIRYEWTVTVNGPEGTLHEAFFDPITVGTAVAADSSNGVLKPSAFTDANGTSTTIERIAWEPAADGSGTVKLKLTPHDALAGHIVDFIALDGSEALSLTIAGAKVDAANSTLSWRVESQPWQSGDLLMLRIREGCSGGTAVPNPGANPGLVSDCDVLLAAKDNLQGTGSLNWAEDTALSTWDGITTAGTPSRVTRLLLPNESLSGSIPSSLGSLFELTHLDLSRNSLTGEIPRELGWLYNLESLKLGGNALTGCIPLSLKDVATNDLSSLNLLYCEPPAPGAPVLGTVTETSVALSWTVLPNAGRYRVEYRAGNAGDWNVASDAITGTGYSVEGLESGTEYAFRVAAHGDGVVYRAVFGEPSAVLLASTPLPPPPAPTGMSAGTTGLSWDGAKGVAQWRLEFRTAGYRQWNTLGPSSSTSSSVSRSGSVNHFRVRAYGDGETYEEVWSEPSGVVVLLPHEQFAFSFSPDPLTLGGMSDVWTVPDGVTQVYLTVDYSAGGGKEAGTGDIRVRILDSEGGVTSTLDVGRSGGKGVLSGVAAGTRMRIDADADAFDKRAPVVTVQFHGGFNVYADVIAAAAIQKEARPSGPTGGSAELDEEGQRVTLEWSPGDLREGSKPDHYRVVIGNPADADSPLYEDLSVGDETDPARVTIADAWTRLGVGTHRAEVRHCNAAGGCSEALSIEFTLLLPLAPAPAGLRVGEVTDVAVELQWEAVEGLNRYLVERRTGADGEWTTVSDAVSGTSYTVEGLSPETAYQFRVSVHGDGTEYREAFGEPSSVVSATTLPLQVNLFALAGPTQVEEGETATYIVAVSGGTADAVTLQYAVTGSTATAGKDYPTAESSGTVTVPAGGDEARFTVTVTEDDLSETEESFTVTVSEPSLGRLSTVTSIAASDAMTVTLTGPSVVEEGETATYGVSVSGGVPTEDLTASYRVAGHTATAGEDYPANSGGTLTIPAGGTSATFSVVITDDELSEKDEGFFVNISEVGGGGGPPPVLGAVAVATGIAASDPLTGDLSGPSEVMEGETATYTVDVSGGRPSAELTVQYTVTGSAATAGTETSAVRTGSATIPAGGVRATFTVDTSDDGVVELGESFTVAIIGLSGGGGPEPSLGTASVVTTVTASGPLFDEDSYRFSVDERAAVGDPVGVVTATGAGGDPVTYSIASGNGDGKFAIDSATGTITVAGELDFREAGSHSLKVKAEDGMGDTTTVTVNVTVTTVCVDGTAVPDPANNPGLVDDCRALLAARDTLRGTATLNWGATVPMENWQGVELKGSPLRVAELNLRLLSTKLDGSIPSELGRLTGLRVLNFEGNLLTGAIPEGLGKLTSLESLYLQDNRLAGDIPTQMGDLTSLRILRLEDNTLTGTIPTDLGDLVNLEVLNLIGNALTGAIPSELGNLANLQELSLNNNSGMSGELPTEIGNLPNLETLRLRRVGLTGEIPTELGNLTNLTLLDMASNELTGGLPSRLSDLTDLRTLYLGDNRLTAEIPSSWRSMANLRYFYLRGGNQFTGCNPMEMDLLEGTDVDNLGLSPCPVHTLSLSGPAEATEGETATYTVTVAGDTHAAAITVSYSVTAGTATAGEDYSEADASGTVTIPVGATTATFAIAITDDDLAEEAETLTVTVSGPTGGGNGAILSITTTSVETTITASDSTS